MNTEEALDDPEEEQGKKQKEARLKTLGTLLEQLNCSDSERRMIRDDINAIKFPSAAAFDEGVATILEAANPWAAVRSLEKKYKTSRSKTDTLAVLFDELDGPQDWSDDEAPVYKGVPDIETPAAEELETPTVAEPIAEEVEKEEASSDTLPSAPPPPAASNNGRTTTHDKNAPSPIIGLLPNGRLVIGIIGEDTKGPFPGNLNLNSPEDTKEIFLGEHDGTVTVSHQGLNEKGVPKHAIVVRCGGNEIRAEVTNLRSGIADDLLITA